MSGLRYDYLKDTDRDDVFEVTERLALTVPDEHGACRVVPEADAEARWLYAVPGQTIPRSEAEKYGLLTPEPEPKPANRPRPRAKGKRT